MHLRGDDEPVARDRLLSIHYFLFKVLGPLDGSVEQFDSLIEMFRAPVCYQTDAVL